jgi:outer membrane protein TolC
MRRIQWSLMLLLCFVAGIAAAQEPLSLSLEEAVQMALQQNPDVQIANLSVLEADAGFAQTRSQLLPQLGAQAVQRRQTLNLRGIGLDFPGIPPLVGPFSVFDARPALSMRVLDVSAWQSVSAARKRIEQAQAGKQAVRQGTALSVIAVYLQAQELQSRIEASRGRLASATAVERQVRDRFEAGTASRLDLSRAILQMKNEQAFLRRSEGGLAATLQGLLRLIGREQDAALQLRDDLPKVALPLQELATAEAEATRANPELRALARALDAAKADKNQTRLQRLPRVSFVADYGANGVTPNESLGTYQYAGIVEFPLFTSGRIRGEIQAASARELSAREALRAGQLKVLADLRSAHAEWQAGADSVVAAGEAVTAARENLELSRARYDAGIDDSVSVLQAQATLAEIENLEIAAIVERETARARFLFATGDVLPYLER